MNEESQTFEQFPVISEEPELRVMAIIMEAMRRHLLPSGDGTISDADMEPARRVARYIAERVGAK